MLIKIFYFYQHKSYIKWIFKREFNALIESPHMPVRLHPILSCSAPPTAPNIPEELWILNHSPHTTGREKTSRVLEKSLTWSFLKCKVSFVPWDLILGNFLVDAQFIVVIWFVLSIVWSVWYSQDLCHFQYYVTRKKLSSWPTHWVLFPCVR